MRRAHQEMLPPKMLYICYKEWALKRYVKCQAIIGTAIATGIVIGIAVFAHGKMETNQMVVLANQAVNSE